MDRCMKNSVFGLIVIIVMVQNIGARTSEPDGAQMCYKTIEYNAKLLERLAIVELLMKGLEDKFNQEYIKWTDERHAMNKKYEELQQKLRKDQNKQNKKLNDMESRIERKLTNMAEIEEKHDALQEKLTDEQRTKLDEVQSRMDSKLSNLNHTALAIARNLTGIQQTTLDMLDERSRLLQADVDTKLSEYSKLIVKHANDVELSLETMETRVNSSLRSARKPAVVFHMAYPCCGHAPGPDATLKFTATWINKDNVYNKATGEFTAPTAGVYILSARLCGLKNKKVTFYIRVNGEFVSAALHYDRDSDHTCTTTTAVAQMEAGDTARVETGGLTDDGDTIYGGGWNMSTFMGVLVQ